MYFFGDPCNLILPQALSVNVCLHNRGLFIWWLYLNNDIYMLNFQSKLMLLLRKAAYVFIYVKHFFFSFFLVKQLVKDYQAWASGDASRQALGTGQI